MPTKKQLGFPESVDNSGTKRRRGRPPKSSQSASQPDFTPSEIEEIAELAKKIPSLDDEEKRALIRQLKPSQRRTVSEIQQEQRERAAAVASKIPKNDDELWQYIKDRTGLSIPRVSVCEDHQAPFDFIADAFFNRERAILVMAGREGGKTIGVSILHVINSELKSGIEGCTFGAILPQAKRAYKHVKSFIYTRDEEGRRIARPEIEGDPTRMETHWKNGSSVELLVGSVSGVNSPHPQVVHADEIDLMEEEVFSESRSMSSSGTGIDGRRIPALDIATSTRKSTKGLMQKLLDEIADAKREGHRSVWRVYSFCFAEIAEEQPNCRCVDPIDRVHRLVKLGLDPCSLCSCNEVVKGTWGTRMENGVEKYIPRTLESVCRGRLFRSRGWMVYDDIVAKFLQNSQAVWEAQMECRRPMADGLYLPNFSRQRCCVRGWIPRPEYGRLTMGVDWGGTSPSCCTFVQGPLLHPVELPGYDFQPIVVPQGAYVVFDEIYQAGIGATKLADMVCGRESTWRAQFPTWRVRGRFADMAGAQQRADWHEHDPPLRTQWYISRHFDSTVETFQDIVNDGLFYVDANRCTNVCDDAESWRQKNGREIHDESSHSMASLRYVLANCIVLERRTEREQLSNAALPVVKERSALDSGALAAVGFGAPASNGVETEQWRRSFGQIGSQPGRGVNDWRTGTDGF